jgi:hypothetical protein
MISGCLSAPSDHLLSAIRGMYEASEPLRLGVTDTLQGSNLDPIIILTEALH